MHVHVYCIAWFCLQNNEWNSSLNCQVPGDRLLTLGACATGTVVVLCVCMCVCYHASCYIPGLYDANKVPLDFLRHFQGMYCVNFVENASFKSSGDICWPLWPSLLLDELSIDERDSDGFISRLILVVCSSYNLIDSSLITLGYQLHFLALDLLIWHTCNLY